MADVRVLLVLLTAVILMPKSVIAEDAESAAALIEKLRADDFDERQVAMDKLTAMGDAARPALEKAARETDPQVQDVAKQLLAKLEKATILVMAFDRDGKPAVDASGDLYIYRQDQGGKQDNLPVTVGADGTVLINDQPTGFVSANVTWKKWQLCPEGGYGGWQELKSGNNPMLYLLTPGGTLSAVAKDKDGKPLKDVQVSLQQQGAMDPDLIDIQTQMAEMWGQRSQVNGSTDAEGKAKLENVGDGVYNIVFKLDGYSVGLISNVRVTQGAEIELPAVTLAPRLRTKVCFTLQKADGSVVKSGKVNATLEPIFEGANAAEKQRKYRRMAQEIEMRNQRNMTDTDETGKVTLENVALGKYRLSVRMDNDSPQDLGMVEVTEGVIPVAVEKKPDEKKPDEKKPDEAKPDEAKPDEKKPVEKKQDEKQPDEKKPDEKKPDEKKPDEKKPDEKKPDEKKPDEKKPDEKKPDEKKPDEKKPDEKKADESKLDYKKLPPPAGDKKAGDKDKKGDEKKPDEKVCDLGVMKFTKGGGVRGKVLSHDGKGMRYANINAMRLEAGDTLDQRYIQRFQWRSGYVNSAEDGSFELKNLMPGKYALSIYTQTGRTLMVFGVEVESGKTVEAPEIKVPERTGGTQASSIKGTVMMPDGKPAAGAQIMVSFAENGGSSQTNCNDKGEFNFQYMQDYAIATVTVRTAKCKPISLDLTDKKLNPSALTIRLEKQEYGILKVKVVDEAGAPIAGAGVGPRASRSNYNYGRTGYQKIKTDEKGIARLTGLATGERVLDVDRQGYYIKDDVKATVEVDKETETVVTMKKGVTVKGKLELPAGTPTRNVLVNTSTQTIRASSVSENGEFTLEGFPPGKYTILPMVPGLIAQKDIEIQVEEGKPLPPLAIKMVRRGAAVLDVGKPQVGATGSVIPAENWPPKSGEQLWRGYNPGGSVDGEGKAMVWGPAPGKYRLMLNPPTDNMRYMYDNGSNKTVTFAAVSEPFDITELKSIKDLPSLTAQAVKTPSGTGSVTGRLVLDKPPSMGNQSQGSLSVRIVGANIQGTTAFGYPHEFNRQNQGVPIVIGTPPPDYVAPAPGQFSGKGIPAGEYEVLMDITWYNYQRNRIGAWSADQQKTETKSIKKFTIKDGETVDLGEIKVTTPVPQGTTPQAETMLDPEDIVPVFQP